MKHKRKYSLKKRIKKFSNGAISLMLCIVMTPFLSLTLTMVEYARYQEVISITKELMELTGVSVSADYDTYIHDRFGLLTASQEGELGAGTEEIFKYNMKTLGNQTTITDGSFSVTGDHCLADTDVLRRQVVSVSELAGPTAVLFYDLELDGLLAKLNEIQGLTNITGAIADVTNVVEKVEGCITSLENLKTAASELKTQISGTIGLAQSFTTNLKSLFVTINTDEDLVLPEDYTVETLSEIATTFAEDYLDDVKALIESANTLKSSITTSKEKLDAFVGTIGGVEDSLSALKTAIDEVGSSGSGNADAATDAALESIQDVVDEMDKLIDDTLDDMKTSTINAAKETLNGIYDDILEQTGLGPFINRYAQIINGTCFEDTELEDDEKEDILGLLQVAWDLYKGQGETGIGDYLVDLFVPDVSGLLQIDTLIGRVTTTISNAMSAIATDNLGKATDMLNKLVDLLESLFSMQLFYNPNFNAFVNISASEDNPYQAFLTAISDVFNAIDKVAKFFAGEGVSFKEALKAVKDGLKGAGDAIGAMLNIALSKFNGLIRFVSNLAGGNIGSIYEDLVIAAYVRHNLTNRTTEISSASGITNFSYAEIVRPSSGSDSNTLVNGMNGIVDFITAIKNGGIGTDTNFVQAEQEYVLIGSNSEYFNQLMTFMDVYSLRFVLNLLPVFTDTCVNTIAAAATIGAFLVYLIYLVAEPLLDTILLVNGCEVGLIKGGCWMTPSGLPTYISRLAEKVTSNAEVSELLNGSGQTLANNMSSEFGVSAGLGAPSELLTTDYDTHMLILLMVQTNGDTMISRIGDIINLEASSYYSSQGKSFDMNKTYTAITLEAEVRFNPLFDVGEYFDGSPLDMTGRVKQMVCY